MNDNKGKNIQWYMLAVMAFSTVWGFGNIINGFVYFNGMQVIFSWIMMFGLYFIPYTLMVGELGSTFRHSGGASAPGSTGRSAQNALTTRAGRTGPAM